jgi:hypothetical protein
VEGRPGIFTQRLLEPQLIRGVERAFSIQAGGHQFRYVSVLGDRHADYRPLRHRGIMPIALERPGVLTDL